MSSPGVLLAPEKELPAPSGVLQAMEVEVWDDDALFGAHETAAADLLDEYVRTEAQQSARDEIARKAIGIITSAAEGTFTDAGKKLQLIDNLVASLGALCDHSHLSELLDKHLGADGHRHASEHEDDANDDDEPKKEKASKSLFFITAERSGSLAVKPLFPAIRRLLKLSY